MRTHIFLSILLSLILIVFSSCGENTEPMETNNDQFDRAAMLTDWADLIIIPAFESYDDALSKLSEDADAFYLDSNQETLDQLRVSFLESYRAWQKVAMFNIGKAEEISLINVTNIYPTDTLAIQENINSQSYNLSLPSSNDEQGFPAIDYLLYGLSNSDDVILESLRDAGTRIYLIELVDKLHELSTTVLDDWKGSFRNSFINNSGSSATASVDKLVNDFIFYYERFFRAGKIGIPAGVFSGSPIATTIEAPYSGIYSKELFFEAFDAVRSFFEGTSHDGLMSGISLVNYLDFIQTQNQTVDIAGMIQNQWAIAADVADNLLPNFVSQINEDNEMMLQTYDELNKAVVFLKVDMLQALNIQVDFVDADGD